MAKFPSNERIKSKLILEQVYNEGTLIKAYPLKIKFLEVEELTENTVQIVISIPKRIIKKATARNRIRRQLKEIYRLNKTQLIEKYQTKNKGLALFLIYTGKESPTFDHLENKLKELISKLEQDL